MSHGIPAALGTTAVRSAARTDVGLTACTRPDGCCVVRPEETWTGSVAAAAAALAERCGVTVVTMVAEHALRELGALAHAGFTSSRREVLITIDVEAALRALGAAEPPAGVEIRSATEVVEARLLLLDDELRQDVPGTFGWRSTEDEFREHTFADPAFDPRTYLVAVEPGSGALLGLARVWMNPGGPRLGLVGVRRAFRRRGIGAALLARAFAAVAATGAETITAEYDTENRASHALALHLGARRVGTVIELVYEPHAVVEGAVHAR